MPSGGVRSITEIRGLLHRVLRAIRANWPATAILLRADHRYCGPRGSSTGVAPTGLTSSSALRRPRPCAGMSSAWKPARWRAMSPPRTRARRARTRSSTTAPRAGAGSRVIARVEAGADGTDTRFIVTSLPTRNPRVLYEELYCRRGAAENRVDWWKTHLAADRTSCTKATANQFRLFLHAGAYWLMWSVRSLMPKRSMWRVAQVDTLRLRLIKIAARVVELKPRSGFTCRRLARPSHPAGRSRADPAGLVT